MLLFFIPKQDDRQLKSINLNNNNNSLLEVIVGCTITLRNISFWTACVFIIRFHCLFYPFFNKAPCYCWARGFYRLNLSCFYLQVSILCFLCKLPRKSFLSQQGRGNKRKAVQLCLLAS